MPLTGVSHVAYRCRNAAEIVDFYHRKLRMRYSFAVAENQVPSTGEFFPHIHIFIEIIPGTYLGFFELADCPDMTFDEKTPRWVQHLALSVSSVEEVQRYRDRLVEAEVEVLGVTDHGLFRSIYFFDPSGHRIEITCKTMSPGTLEKLESEAVPLLEHWEKTKRAPDIGWHRRHVARSVAEKAAEE